MVRDTLIIAPHCDDEVLGCSTFLDEHTVVLYFSHRHELMSFDDPTLEYERHRVAEATGIRVIDAFFEGEEQLMPNRLDTIPIVRLITALEYLLKEHQPDTAVLPNSSYNQDHRVLLDAALTALRPHDEIPFVKRVLLYEEPETWGSMRRHAAFNPTYFREVDIDRKVELVKMYESQIRGHRDESYIRAIAKTRGMQSNLPYAEAFEVLRWVE
jgi:LmbE family N-acetylglucosaminyl deacetylase